MSVPLARGYWSMSSVTIARSTLVPSTVPMAQESRCRLPGPASTNHETWALVMALLVMVSAATLSRIQVGHPLSEDRIPCRARMKL
jgi:hypothetical protein